MLAIPKPFISRTIERFGDTAMVTIARVTFTETGHKREVLEHYETMSKGAAASARKSARKFTA